MKKIAIILGLIVFSSPVSADLLESCLENVREKYEEAWKDECVFIAEGAYEKNKAKREGCRLPRKTAEFLDKRLKDDEENCYKKEEARSRREN